MREQLRGWTSQVGDPNLNVNGKGPCGGGVGEWIIPEAVLTPPFSWPLIERWTADFKNEQSDL